MDFLSVLGWLGGIAVILFGIVFDKDSSGLLWENLQNFYDLPSIAVVLGGVIVALMVSRSHLPLVFPFRSQ
ncbi:hypothetical protein [Anaerotruncus colihominis]|uniref:hypothetical protein n=1 Tax=Anaerotruncus colihominis TaxID=169435 RepID=UPI003AB3C4CC